MTNSNDRFEERLGRLLGAASAGADPAVLARARARIAAAEAVPRPLAWLGTPVALAGACALLLAVSVAGAWIVRTDARSTREMSLVSALVGDDGSYGLPSAATARAVEGIDSGAVTP